MRNLLRHYWPHMRKHWVLILIVTVCELFSTILYSSVVPILYKTIIDTAQQATDPSLVAQRLISLVGWLAVALVAASLVFRRTSNFSMTRLRALMSRDLSRYVFDELQRHSYTFFSNEFAGGLVAKQGRFVGSFDQIYSFFQFTVANAVIGMGVSIVALLFVSPLLASLFLGWTIIFVTVVLLMVRPQRAKNIERAAAQSKLTAQFADALSNIITIKSFAGSLLESGRLQDAADTALEKRLIAGVGQNAINLVQSTLTVIFQIGMMFIAVILWTRSAITTGTIVLIQIYMIRAADTVWDIGRSSLDFQTAINDAKEMTDILDKPVDVLDPEHPVPSHISAGSILFRDVTFGYGDRAPIFEHFDLAIRPGEKVALVGHSGAGKTTVTKLLLRFLDVTGGSIEIDGQDIRSITQDDLRRAIGYVAQEPMLFHRSLRDNIAYGKPDATDAMVLDAAQSAHAHEFIEKLPETYATMVGERGVKLSGGERQRVAIARAMLKNAPILVLDEATSALDSESEGLIQAALAKAMEGRTTIAIAHRLSTIKHMDRILVFDGGKIVEQGTHDELIAQGGIYGSLWAQQSGGFIADDE